MTAPPFNRYLGIEIVRHEAGTAEAAIDLAPHHLNRRGVAHGGVITALLDSALGAAVISAIPAEWWCATTSLATQFLDGPGPGRLTATGRVTRRGGRVAFATGEARDGAGRLVATAQGTWHLWPQRPPGPEKRDARSPAAGCVKLRGSGEVLRVGKIVAVGRNYAAHAAEMGVSPGEFPVVFLKPPTALVHDGATVRLPAGHGEVHHEVELVAVIGEPGASIPRERALEHVLGYAVGLDLTLREVQARAKQRGEPWSLAKGFDGAAPISAVAPRAEVGDGAALEIVLEINGRRVQAGHTSSMLHSVAALVSYVSSWMRLERGDLIFTGTPEGVGPLHAGDTLEARIECVGTLRVRIGDAPG